MSNVVKAIYTSVLKNNEIVDIGDFIKKHIDISLPGTTHGSQISWNVMAYFQPEFTAAVFLKKYYNK